MSEDSCIFDGRWGNTHREYRNGEFNLCFAMKPPAPLFLVGDIPIVWATTGGRSWDTKCITLDMTTRYLEDIAHATHPAAVQHIEDAVALLNHV